MGISWDFLGNLMGNSWEFMGISQGSSWEFLGFDRDEWQSMDLRRFDEDLMRILRN